MTTHTIDAAVHAALQIPGWMTETELRYLFEQASTRRMILEIGSWQGRSAKAMAMATPGVLFCCDDWRGEAGTPLPRADLRQRFTEHLLPELLRGACVHLEFGSVDLARHYAALHPPMRFDMIFIDGSHDLESVKADVVHWLPLLMPDGLLCGHDWGINGVMPALQEVLSDARPVADTIWEWRAS